MRLLIVALILVAGCKSKSAELREEYESLIMNDGLPPDEDRLDACILIPDFMLVKLAPRCAEIATAFVHQWLDRQLEKCHSTSLLRNRLAKLRPTEKLLPADVLEKIERVCCARHDCFDWSYTGPGTPLHSQRT